MIRRRSVVLAATMLIAACTSSHHAAAPVSGSSRVSTAGVTTPTSPTPLSSTLSAGPPSAQTAGPTATPATVSPAASSVGTVPSAPVAAVTATVRVVTGAQAGSSEQRVARVFVGLGRSYLVTARDDDTPTAPYGVSQVSVITPRSRPAVRLSLQGSLTDPLFGGGVLWFVRGVGSRPEDFPGSLDLIRVDPVSLRVTGTVRVGRPYALVYADGAVWIATGTARLLRVDARTMAVTIARKFYTPLGALAFAGDQIWALQSSPDQGVRSKLIAIDPVTMRKTAVITLPGDGQVLAVTSARLFVALAGSPSALVAYDTGTHRQLWTHSVATESYSDLGAGGSGSLWYLAGSGRLGHLRADGRPAGSEVDLSSLDPTDLLATPDGPRLLFPGGYTTLRAHRAG